MRLVHGCLGLGLALIALGCRAKIGDDCNMPADCSQTGDRLCDTTQPDGYCTIFNCDAGSCPDEAVCIGFSSVLSSVAGDEEETTWACADPQSGSRFQRNFCMRSCDSSSDCRSGYRCLDLAASGNPFGAVLVETSRRKNGKVCAVPMTNTDRAVDADAIPGICEGNAADAPGGASGFEVPSSGAFGGGAAGGASVSGAANGGVAGGGVAGGGASGGAVDGGVAGGGAPSGGVAGSGTADGGAAGGGTAGGGGVDAPLGGAPGGGGAGGVAGATGG